MRLVIIPSKSVIWLVGLSILTLIRQVFSLNCVQCDRQGVWYSPEENERHIINCQKGRIKPTKCTNVSHTHCIFNYYKQNGVTTVTERRCGTVEDLSGCTIYKSSRRMLKRHLIGGSNTDTPMTPFKLFESSIRNSHRRRETNSLFVEVCTGGCQEDGCLNGAVSIRFPSLFSVSLNSFSNTIIFIKTSALLSTSCLFLILNKLICA